MSLWLLWIGRIGFAIIALGLWLMAYDRHHRYTFRRRRYAAWGAVVCVLIAGVV